MNSLNLLSARVIGKLPSPPQSATRSSRSRSISEGVGKQSTPAPPRRSASQRSISDSSTIVDEKALSTARREDATKENIPSEETVDEKTPLIDGKDSGLEPEVKPSRNRLHLVAKRLASAFVESLRWILSKLAAPGIYLVTCFYDSEGRFSPLIPLRRKPQKRNSSTSTAHAVGLSGSSDPNERMVTPSSEKRVTRSSAQVLSERSRSTDTLSTSTSDSEVDRKGKGGTRSRDARSKGRSSVSTEDTQPTRRSIRIKLHNEDSTRRRKNKKGQSSAATADSAPDTSSEVITAANLKSPTSPASSLRITKYPHAPAPPRPLIPRRQPSYSSLPSRSSPKLAQKTLVIDLDETLIHSLAKGGRMSSGHMVEVKLSSPAAYNGLSLGPQHPILYYVHKRPHCDDFLRKVCKWYNLVVFTASVQEYADPVIDWLEQERKYFSARYYRQHCTFRNGAYIKDLSSVEPDLSRVVILDNSPLSYIFHEDNAIPIEGWINDPTDNDLLHLIPLFEALQYVTDLKHYIEFFDFCPYNMASKSKKTVSIYSLFKKHSASDKEHVRCLDKSGRITKASHQKKHAIVPEHILARDFSGMIANACKVSWVDEIPTEKIEISRAQILQDATTRLDSTHHILLERLATTSAQSANFVEEAMTARDDLARPLAEEKLQFTGKDGKPSGMVLLGDRMKRFKKVIMKEEKELAALWKEWAEVQELIAGVGVELLGSHAMEVLGQQLVEPTTGTDSVDSGKAAQEIEGEKEKLKQEIETMSNGLIEKTYTSEKEMDTKTQKQRQDFLSALGADY
ncbi:Nuclear envelope morphology protein 1 [Trapelia coarctata]|nr:Nuclear envelope morphology protein 1 [Trapelia coarctata]